MSNYDSSYVRAEQAYRAARIRDQIVSRQERARLRKERSRRRKVIDTWED